MTDAGREVRASWPYTSWKTILNLILRLAEAEAIPPQIDRSFLGGSEGQKTQVLAALRFFGMIDEGGRVTPLLTEIVNDEPKRTTIIRKLLADKYPEQTRLGGIHATSRQLEESFEPYTGDTLRKAMTFYLHAAKFAGHPISTHFKVPTGFARAKGGKRSRTAAVVTPIQAATPRAPSIDDAKSRYLDMLMQRASTAQGAEDEALLDRIERLLGYDATHGGGDDDGE